MKHSDSIKEIADALSRAQGKVMGASKDALNPHFGKKYADLSSIWEACRQALTENGIAVVQSPESTDDCLVTIVETLLMHKSGEWIKGELRMLPVKNDPQGVGSCITYARRYALAAMVGVAPEDDDGNFASGRDAGASYQYKKSTPSTPAMTKEALKDPNVSRAEPSTRVAFDVNAEPVRNAPKTSRKGTSKPVSGSEGVQTAPEDVDQTGELKWELMKIPIGTNTGRTLGEVDHEDRMLLFKSFTPDPKNAVHTYFKAALVLWYKEEMAKETK